MPDARTVECQDCGRRWESTAQTPRCASSECGRSRNVEEVSGQDDQGADELDDDDQEQDTQDADTMDPGDQADDTIEASGGSGAGDGFRPAFETAEQTSDLVDDDGPPPQLDQDDDDRADQDGDDDGDDDQEQPEVEIPEIEPEQLSVAFDLTFDMVAHRRGDHWELEDGEADQLATAWTPVANMYAHVLLAQHTEVAIAALCTVAIVGPKLKEDRRLAQEQKEREQAQPSEAGDRERTARTVEADDEIEQADDWTPPDQGGPTADSPIESSEEITYGANV